MVSIAPPGSGQIDAGPDIPRALARCGNTSVSGIAGFKIRSAPAYDAVRVFASLKGWSVATAHPVGFAVSFSGRASGMGGWFLDPEPDTGVAWSGW